MNVADLVELLKDLDPLMRVVVADAVGIFGAQPEDLHVVDFSNDKALLIAPCEFVESWDASESWERIVKGWPWLTEQHVDAARAWVAAGGADT